MPQFRSVVWPQYTEMTQFIHGHSHEYLHMFFIRNRHPNITHFSKNVNEIPCRDCRVHLNECLFVPRKDVVSLRAYICPTWVCGWAGWGLELFLDSRPTSSGVRRLAFCQRGDRGTGGAAAPVVCTGAAPAGRSGRDPRARSFV